MAKTHVGRKLPPNLVFLFAIAIPISIIGIFIGLFRTHQFDLVVFCFCLGVILPTYLYLSDRGYQIAYDSERIYMREWSFKLPWFRRYPEHSIAYDAIASMEGKFQGNADTKARFMPFEILVLESTVAGEEDVWIYPPSLRDKEVKDLLLYLYDVRPDIFPDYAIEYMHSHKPL